MVWQQFHDSVCNQAEPAQCPDFVSIFVDTLLQMQGELLLKLKVGGLNRTLKVINVSAVSYQTIHQ